MGALAPMLTPQPPRRRRSQQGVGQPNNQQPTPKQPHGPLLRSAQLAQRGALAPARLGRAQRRPEGLLAPQPLCMRRGAQWAGWPVCRRTHRLRGLARRSCLNGAPKARSEFCDAPRPRAPQVARSEAKGRRQWGRLFFGDFLFGDAKESYSHAGRLPASALKPSMPSQPARPASTRSARTDGVWRPSFDKLSPNGWGVAPQLRQAQPERMGCGAPASTSSARTDGVWRPGFDKLSPNGWGVASQLRQACMVKAMNKDKLLNILNGVLFRFRQLVYQGQGAGVECHRQASAGAQAPDLLTEISPIPHRASIRNPALPARTYLSGKRPCVQANASAGPPQRLGFCCNRRLYGNYRV